MAPAELCGVWQMRVNGLTSTFCLVYLDVPDCSNGIVTTVLLFQAILIIHLAGGGSSFFAFPEIPD